MQKGKVFIIGEIHASSGAKIDKSYFDYQTRTQAEIIESLSPSHVLLETTEMRLAEIQGQIPKKSVVYKTTLPLHSNGLSYEWNHALGKETSEAYGKIIETAKKAGSEIVAMDDWRHVEMLVKSTFLKESATQHSRGLHEASIEEFQYYELMDNLWRDSYILKDRIENGGECSYDAEIVASSVEAIVGSPVNVDAAMADRAHKLAWVSMKEAESLNAMSTKTFFELSSWLNIFDNHEFQDLAKTNREDVYLRTIYKLANAGGDVVVVTGTDHAKPDSYLVKGLRDAGLKVSLIDAGASAIIMEMGRAEKREIDNFMREAKEKHSHSQGGCSGQCKTGGGCGGHEHGEGHEHGHGEHGHSHEHGEGHSHGDGHEHGEGGCSGNCGNCSH